MMRRCEHFHVILKATWISTEITAGLYYRVRQNHSVFFKPEDSEDLYVGVTDFVYTFDMDHLQFIDVSIFVLYFYLFIQVLSYIIMT